MKKTVKLMVMCLSIAGLASCSTLGLGGNEDSTGSQDQKSGEEATSPTIVSSSSSAVSEPTAKISLKKSGQDQVVATIRTNYNNNPQGSVKLQWKAPEGSKCYDTSFPITKYGEKNDKTWASVEVKQGGKYCRGEWTANVVYKKDVLATDSITV